jgi:hypothetical protein
VDNNQVTCQVLFFLKKNHQWSSSHRFPHFITHNENLVREMITDRMLLTGPGYLEITSRSHMPKEEHVSKGRWQHVFVQARGE